MKKLMIAAAAAALIGGVEAAVGDDVVYQATYTLKTTVGKASNNTETYNLGWDGVSTFWYQDMAIPATWFDNTTTPCTIVDTVNWTLKSVGGTKVPALTTAGAKNDAILGNLVALANAGTYNVKSLGKWCLTFKYKESVCYRIAGTIKVTGYFTDDECLSTFSPGILDAFGGPTLAKSTKVELYKADASTEAGALVDKKGDIVDVKDNTKGERTLSDLAIAGHGTYGKVYDDDDGSRPGVTAVSGYAVGKADMPDCISCCAVPTPVTTWDCCEVNATDTAVFGTFAIKYNASLTKKLY